MQSGNPAASGGFVVVELPVAVELVLLGLVLLPLLVLGVSVRTCLVNASQHFPLVVVVVVELGVLVVVEVCAIATPMLPASMAAVITPIPIIRMRYFSWCGGGEHPPQLVQNGDEPLPFLAVVCQKKRIQVAAAAAIFNLSRTVP